MNNVRKDQPSPSITELMSADNHISDVRFSPNHGGYYYTAANDAGAGEIFLLAPNQTPTKITGDFNVRGTVGYGGGGFDARIEKIVFCDRSGGIFILRADGKEIITEAAPAFLRTCSPRLSPDEKWVLFVYEQNETNGLGISPANGLSWPRQLALGADFYMHPVWHPDGERIAWAEWDHPDMPWDSARIKIGQLGGMQLRLLEESYIDGGEESAANQPIFSPDGKFLSYIKRNGSWDDLMLFDLASNRKSAVIRGDGFHLRMPDWVQGLHSYQWSADSQFIYFIKYQQGTASIAKLEIATQTISAIPSAPYVWLSQLDVSHDGKKVACIASTPSSPEAIILFDTATTKNPHALKNHMHTRTRQPETITFSNRDQQNGYGLFYPARTQPSDGNPAPCLVKIHSGPTGLKHTGYSVETDFFTAHGFSVAYPNYRGSVSFGYDYQDALRLKWGEAEVEDTIDMIRELARIGLIDREHMAVLGSSAGGFSALHLLIAHPGLFKAAICSYAVSDLVDDAEHTHKFEKYYHRFLTGRYPEEKRLFIERSPIQHIDQIRDPLALFHGRDDRVVSAGQSQRIFDLLSEKNIPCQLKIFEGEGHGFRRAENVEIYYQSILAFLKQYI